MHRPRIARLPVESFFLMDFGPAAFSGLTDPDRARALFRRNVQRVEVETHSYCNRRCGYCPNAAGDRLGPNVRMAEALYARIVGDLASIGFSGALVLSHYNEPLADRSIVARIAQARAALPGAQILIYTNGDYLTPALVDDLAQAGLSYMHLSIHMRPDDIYSDLYAIDRISEICARIGRPVKMKAVRGGEFMTGRIPHGSIDIEIRALNYWKTGQDRGGLIAGMDRPANRTAPCFFPFAHFYVGYTGDVVPCCHLRGDTPAHAPYVTAKVQADAPIFLAYASEAAARWRRSMTGRKLRAAPCATCTAGAPQAGSPLEAAMIAAEPREMLTGA